MSHQRGGYLANIACNMADGRAIALHPAVAACA